MNITNASRRLWQVPGYWRVRRAADGRAADWLRRNVRHHRTAFAYARRRYFVENPAARRGFTRHHPPLTDLQSRVVADMRRDGIATVHFRDLFADPDRWRALESSASRFIEHAQHEAAVRTGETHERWDFSKRYLVREIPEEGARLAADDLWLRLALDERLLPVVNSYLGLWSRLIYVNKWYTIPQTGAKPRVASQQWHRDPEDRRLVKVFLYLTDVDEASGPFQYIPGTGSFGRYRNLWAHSSPSAPFYPSVYPDQSEVERRFPPSAHRTCVAQAGTFIFADTHGLHRGGLSTRNPRVFATWTFVTPASTARRSFVLDGEIDSQALSKAACFAVR